MARQFREQLEEEVQLEETRKAKRTAPPEASDPAPQAHDPPPPADPPLPPTFSHAHPTDVTGADTSVRAGPTEPR
jgi:hypothetical protein